MLNHSLRQIYKDIYFKRVSFNTFVLSNHVEFKNNNIGIYHKRIYKHSNNSKCFTMSTDNYKSICKNGIVNYILSFNKDNTFSLFLELF